MALYADACIESQFTGVCGLKEPKMMLIDIECK